MELPISWLYTLRKTGLVARIVNGLRNGKEYTKRACMFALGASGEAAVPSLLEVMAVDDLDTATFAVHLLQTQSEPGYGSGCGCGQLDCSLRECH